MQTVNSGVGVPGGEGMGGPQLITGIKDAPPSIEFAEGIKRLGSMYRRAARRIG